MRFIKVELKDFSEAYSLIEESFPIYERRLYSEARTVLNEKDYTLYHIEENGEKVGLISVWNLDGFYFIEHFAIHLRFRNNGFGSKALNLAKNEFKALVLEAEPEINEIAKRRLDFYKRNGFCKNSFKYMQPAYREGEDDVELVILSYPRLLENDTSVVEEIYKRVYGR